MTTLAQKIAWGAWASLARLVSTNSACPECGNDTSSVVDRKALVTELRRCSRCRLMYRVPTTGPSFDEMFYNKSYSQGFTTDVPDDHALQEMLTSGFKRTVKDYEKYVDALVALGARKGERLFDFGASWGYGSWQLAHFGFAVIASEIAEKRLEFARGKLRLSMVKDPFSETFLRESRRSFDIFFSCHVLEHVPKPGKIWELAQTLLSPGGLFVAITPNGSQAARQANSNWRKLWGLVHPNLLDDEFYFTRFRAPGRVVGSLPLDPAALAEWNGTGDLRLPLEGPELLFAARL